MAQRIRETSPDNQRNNQRHTYKREQSTKYSHQFDGFAASKRQQINQFPFLTILQTDCHLATNAAVCSANLLCGRRNYLHVPQKRFHNLKRKTNHRPLTAHPNVEMFMLHDTACATALGQHLPSSHIRNQGTSIVVSLRRPYLLCAR